MPENGEIRRELHSLAPGDTGTGGISYCVWSPPHQHWLENMSYENAVFISMGIRNETAEQVRERFHPSSIVDVVGSPFTAQIAPPQNPIEGVMYENETGHLLVYMSGQWQNLGLPTAQLDPPEYPIMPVGDAEQFPFLDIPADPNAVVFETGVGAQSNGNLVLSSGGSHITISETDGSFEVGATSIVMAPNPTPPSNPKPGAMYFNTDDDHLYVFTSNGWHVAITYPAPTHHQKAEPTSGEVITKAIQKAKEDLAHLETIKKKNRFNHIMDEIE